VFLLLVVVEVVETAVARLRGGAPPHVTVASFAVMLGTLVVNLVVVRYESGTRRVPCSCRSPRRGSAIRGSIPSERS